MQIASYKTTEIKNKLKIGSTYGLSVAAAFWLPDVVIHALTGKSFFGREVLIITLFLPLIAAAIFYLIRKIRKYTDSQTLTIVSSILGVWITGPFFMMISSSFSDGGFSRTDIGFFQQLSFLITCTAGFPIFTFMMSTYDGTLFALLIASGLIPLTSLIKRTP